MTDVAAAPAAAPSAPANTDTAAAPDAGANPEGAQPPREKRRIVLRDLADDDEFVSDVDGAEVAKSIAEFRKEYQRYGSSTQRYQAAKELARKAETDVASARAEAAQHQAAVAELQGYLRDPVSLAQALSDAGVNIDQYLAMMTEGFGRVRSESPEARQLRQMRAQQQAQERQSQQQREAQRRADVEHYTKVYTKAFGKIADVAKIPGNPAIRDHVNAALVQAVSIADRRGIQLDEAGLVRVALDSYGRLRSAYLDTVDGSTAQELVKKHAPKPAVQTAPAAERAPQDQGNDGRYVPRRNPFADGKPQPRDAISALKQHYR